MKIDLAPLQGLTDYRFRNLHQYYFGGIDTYYTPYLRKQKGAYKKSVLKDLHPENNKVDQLVPQVMTNSFEEFSEMCEMLKPMGYSRININMGCPYPMVTNRKLGAGLLPESGMFEELVQKGAELLQGKLSLKMRLGLSDASDIDVLIPIMNALELESVIIHPRVGKQMYKGSVDLQVFKRVAASLNKPVVYNGDVVDLMGWTKLSDAIAGCNRVMIGRGVLVNPYLPLLIKTGEYLNEDEMRKTLSDFYCALLEEIEQAYEGGDKQIVLKMLGYWEYHSQMYQSAHKVFKKIKKSKSVTDLKSNMLYLINNEPFLDKKDIFSWD